MPSNAFYAVRNGYTPGIYLTWSECEAQVKGFPKPKFKKFASAVDAEEFVNAPDNKLLSPAKRSHATTAVTPTVQAESRKRARLSDISNDTGYDVVFCDGACKGNGMAGSIAGIGVWWGRDDPRNLSERCPGKQTNNRAELIAIARVLETAPWTKKPLLIKTDSQYSISCFEEWIAGWVKKNWCNAKGEPVKNPEIIRYIAACMQAREQRGQKVLFEYVKGHSGDEGNDGADALATKGTTLPFVEERDWEALLRSVEESQTNVKPAIDPSTSKTTLPEKPKSVSSSVPVPVPAPAPPSNVGNEMPCEPSKQPRGVKRSYEVDFGPGAIVEAVRSDGSKVVIEVTTSANDVSGAPVKVTPITAPPPPAGIVAKAVSVDEVDLAIFENDYLDEDELEEWMNDDN